MDLVRSPVPSPVVWSIPLFFVKDYFESLERFLDKSSASQSSGGIVFNFDKGMDLTDADRATAQLSWGWDGTGMTGTFYGRCR